MFIFNLVKSDLTLLPTSVPQRSLTCQLCPVTHMKTRRDVTTCGIRYKLRNRLLCPYRFSLKIFTSHKIFLSKPMSNTHLESLRVSDSLSLATMLCHRAKLSGVCQTSKTSGSSHILCTLKTFQVVNI